MEKLDAVKLEKYLVNSVNKLAYIDYQYAFEEKKENYYNFVKHVYKVAEKYNISNKKHIFSLILLWHVEGDSINQDEEFLNILASENMHNHEKAEYFKHRAISSMKKEKL